MKQNFKKCQVKILMKNLKRLKIIQLIKKRKNKNNRQFKTLNKIIIKLLTYNKQSRIQFY